MISSLGKASGRGKCLVENQGFARDIQANFEIHLSEAGKKHLGGYLALAAGIDTQVESYMLEVKGKDLGHLDIEVTTSKS